jgi:hypothetical protein
MNHGLESYDKYSVKTGRDGNWMFEKDGSPILDEKISSGLMLDETTVKTLNGNVKSFGFYLVGNEDVKKTSPIKKEEPVVIAKIELPQPPNGEELKKDLTLDKLKSFNNEELNAVLALCSKAEMLGLVGIELPKQKLQITNHSNCIVMVKEKLNELKEN